MNMSDDCNSAVDRTNQMFLCYIKKQPPRSAVMKTGLYLKAVSTSSPWNSQFGALISCAESKNVSGCCRWEEDGGGRRVFPRRSIASLASCQKYRCVQSFVLFFFLSSLSVFYGFCWKSGLKSSVWNYVSVRYMEPQSGMKAAVPPERSCECVCVFTLSASSERQCVCLSSCLLAPCSCTCVCVCVCVCVSPHQSRDFPMNCSI